MKKLQLYSFILLLTVSFWGCQKDKYPGGEISPYIALYDLRNIYKGQDVTLTKENMLGSTTITGTVVSDHSGGNLPAGLLIVQDNRRLSQLRGISIPIGAEAAKYQPGDSVKINVEGKVLKKIDGILQLTGVEATGITKVSSGNTVISPRVPTSFMLTNPDQYESVLSVIVKGGFDPLPNPGDVLSGNKALNDGFGTITLHTEANANFSNEQAPVLANFYGILFNSSGTDPKPAPHFRLRAKNDVVILSSVIEIPPVIITGIMSDVDGGDGNYEYVQFLATRDIDFAATPFSVVVTNNANASAPSGFLPNGWATGNMRTYKLNLNAGTAAKGSYFYSGGTGKRINGASSTSMSTSNWIKAYDYVAKDGEGFGAKTGGYLANSGNACGVAIFEGTNITGNSKPVDVMFISGGGSLYTPTPTPMGYRITNNDWYDVKNPITLQDQPFYRQGSNTLFLPYPPGQGYFYVLGGEYNLTLGRWTKARVQNLVLLSKASLLTEIEGETATKLK